MRKIELLKRIEELESTQLRLIQYTDYLAVNLDKSISYSEYIAEETAKRIIDPAHRNITNIKDCFRYDTDF